jgi:5'-3' exonuclease|tara:strand:+ start:1169 stop:2065 length:897 start_codon:yes stop_codon:yes gene_type:complete
MPLIRAKIKTKGENGRTALIDGDVLVYSCGFASDIRTYTCSDGSSFQYKKEAKEHCSEFHLDVEAIKKRVKAEPVENCLHSVKLMIKDIKEKSEASNHKIYLTGKGNFRHDLPSPYTYKGNRKDTPKPLHYQAIRVYMVSTWDAIITDGQEADDAMGIAQVNSPEGTTTICTTDKDLDMIAGHHYNWNKKENYTIGEFEGILNFYQQILKGDRTDNIFGIKGIGDVKARQILWKMDNEKELSIETQLAYAENGKTPEEWLTNARLLWIRREEGQMWTPEPEHRTSWLQAYMETLDNEV